MSVELLHTLSVASFIAAGVLLVVSILLFFLFRVPRIYGDLSARTAKRAIAQIRRQNEGSGNLAYKPNPIHTARSIGPDKVTYQETAPLKSDASASQIWTEDIFTAGETAILYGEDREIAVEEGRHSDFMVEVEMGFAESTEIIE